MSALLHVGEADHHILNADAEISHAVRLLPNVVQGAAVSEGHNVDEQRRALTTAQFQLAHARSVIMAVRLLLRSHGLAELLAYHETMEARLRLGAAAMRVVLNNPLAANADLHAQRAKLLRDLIGGPNGGES